MVLVGLGCFSHCWASLVVLALVGMSGKSKIFGSHWLFFFANFWINCPPLFFRGARHLQYLQNNFSPGESPRKKNTQLGSLLEVFPTLRPPPCFFHIPFISFQKTSVGHSGNGSEMCRFQLFFDNSCQFLG